MPKSLHHASVQGTGVGLRRALMGPLADATTDAPAFLETAPENWMGIGGALGRKFRSFTERYPFVTHGLSLDIGGPRALDEDDRLCLQSAAMTIDAADPARSPTHETDGRTFEAGRPWWRRGE